MKTFGNNLRSLRESRRMTQTELGKALGVSCSTISMYEIGAREPNFELVCIIANYFGVKADYLLSNHPELNDGEEVIRMEVDKDEQFLLLAYRDAEEVYKGIALEMLQSHRKK